MFIGTTNINTPTRTLHKVVVVVLEGAGAPGGMKSIVRNDYFYHPSFFGGVWQGTHL